MKRTIKVDVFDKVSILEAVEALESYYEELEAKVKKLCIMLADIGVEVAKISVVSLPYSTGDLESSIYSIYDDRNQCALVKADNEHAVFVEFGTGLVGEGTYTNEDYLSLAEQYGWQGYYVGGFEGKEFTSSTGREGWITIMNDGKVRFTEGQEATHFMDNAGRAIEREFKDAVRVVFGID